MKTKTAFFSNHETAIDQVFGNGAKEHLAQISETYPVVISSENFESHAQDLGELEVIFSTWGMPVLNEEQIAKLPKLKALFYAAGSVKYFAKPFLKQQVVVVSGWAANAIPVAEFTVSQILLANKGYFRNIRDCVGPEGYKSAFLGLGNYRSTVALLGAGMVGRSVVGLLSSFQLEVVVFDPFLSEEEANRLAFKKVSLEEAFQYGRVVSNHLADVPETRGMLRAHHFHSMLENSVFVNTGRGATVIEADLIDILKQRPDLTALLDITDPEPPRSDSLLYQLPNAILSSHIAGSIGGEVSRIANTVIEEFFAWQENKPLRYAVTLEMLEGMA